MYEFKHVLKTDLLNLFLNPVWIVGSIVLPLLLALIMGFITKGLYGSAVTSFDYYAVTMLIFGALNNSTVAANSFMESRIVKANMRLCSAPIPDFYIYLPKIFASFLFGGVCQTATAVVLALLTGTNFGGQHLAFLWLLLMAVNFFAVSVSILMCCIVKNEETVNMLLSTIVMLLCMLGGGFFPMRGLGSVVGILHNLSPVAWIGTAAFRAAYDGSLTLLGQVAGVLLLVSGLCIACTAKLFNREDYL